MNNTLKHNGLIGTIQYSAADDVLYGKILGIDDLVSYEGNSLAQIKRNFKNAVDEYIALCKKMKKPVQKTYKGSFNVRIKSDVHKKAVFYALDKDLSLNQLVQEAIESYITDK